MRSAFTGDDDVFPAVAVEVVDADLQADAGAFACRRRGDDVLGPGAGFGDPVVVLNGDVVMGAGVFAGVGVIAFAGDEFRLTVVVDVVPGERMALGKLLVDQALTPGGCPVRLRRELFVPIKSVAVAVGPDQVVPAVAIEIEDDDGATGVGQVEIVVILPRSGERYSCRLFVPTGLENDVLSAVAVEVAEAETVAVAALGHDMFFGGDFSVVATDEAEDLHGILRVP